MKRTLTFTALVLGFRLKVTFYCEPRIEIPTLNSDYETDFISATTVEENIDIHLLASSIRSISYKVSELITSQAHELYQAEQIAYMKDIRKLRNESNCQHSDMIQENC